MKDVLQALLECNGDRDGALKFLRRKREVAAKGADLFNAAMSSSMEEEEEKTTCAICLESTDLTAMPCCTTPDPTSSTTRFCLNCIVLLCNHGGGFARCPMCRAKIKVQHDRVVLNVLKARCRTCRQQKVITEGNCCEQCNIGRAQRLQYQCSRCGNLPLCRCYYNH